MKKLLLFFILSSNCLNAQTISLQGRIGTARTLGFKVPSAGIGFAIEHGHRLELNGNFFVSPDQKTFATRRGALYVEGYGVFHRVAAGLAYSAYRSDVAGIPYQKGATLPFIGSMLPARLLVLYLPRQAGAKIIQEFSISNRVRLGYAVAIINHCDQAAPGTTGPCHYGWSLSNFVKVKLH